MGVLLTMLISYCFFLSLHLISDDYLERIIILRITTIVLDMFAAGVQI